jgi:microcin C transport system permease protein
MKKQKSYINSLFHKRWLKFRLHKRGYYSLYIITICYIVSFLLPLLVNKDPLMVKYNGNYYIPAFKYYPATTFGVQSNGEANYRKLKLDIKEKNNTDFVLMPFYPYGPNENLLDEINAMPPTPPTSKNWFGTDDRGRDVFARVLYGFNVSVSFGLLVMLFSFILGTIAGALSGFYGGKTDILFQRVVEVWSALPFLYVIIILSSFITPGFSLLTFILVLLNWVGITLYVRGEVLREKAKEYVFASYVSGSSKFKIITKHILPNSISPIVTFAPFAVVGNIALLVALDFLGFGLQPPTASWGQLIQQGMSYPTLERWWLIVIPLAFQFVTLILIVFIGEGFRDAFDSKQYSRLK